MSEFVPPREDLWVFGYGSLMWRPGFSFIEMQAARVLGFRRDMCFLSIHYRGTADLPGLICGLMEGRGSLCHGRAFRVAPKNSAEVIAYLDERELITSIYLPRTLPVTLADGTMVLARTYVADTSHAQFVGTWTDAEKAAAIAVGCGSEGRSLDYLGSLVAHLDELGIADDYLQRLLTQAMAV